MNRIPILLLFLILTSSFVIAQEPNPSVFYSQGNKKTWLLFQNNNQALYNIITDAAFQMLDERAKHVSELKTKDDWMNYQQNLKSKMFASINEFKKTPLNVQVTGKIKRENFTVEKILFESHPEFYVTACLFIPEKRQKPAPAVIYCSGHTELGFRSETYQKVILNLVEKGFIVFAFDPIGQGERLQYLNSETNKSKIGSSTKEHTYAGIQTLLTGTSLSDYFIWDGVRALDFLETRKEVDMSRIGITGRSGGGTQSALIAAYDERIYAAAPECYITTFKRLLQSVGPQDAEQNPFHAIKLGFDHPDYLHLRAPLPSLIVTTTHDYFSQQGARESFKEAKLSYSAFNKAENIEMAEDFGVHESTKNNRETVYAFFQKHLNLPGNNSDNEIIPFSVEELWVTKTGQLESSIKGNTVFNINQSYFLKKEVERKDLKSTVKTISGVSFTQKLTAAVFTGKIITENYDVEKYFLENSQKNYVLPAYVIKNNILKPNKILFWLSSEGKEKLIADSEIVKYTNAGYTIITADLPGIGELHDPEFSGDGFVQGVPFNYTLGANLTGKSISGIQAESIDLLMQFCNEQNASKQEIHAIIENEISSSFLHFTSFNNPFSKVAFSTPLDYNKDLIETEYYDPKQAYNIVPGSLPVYDFADLISFLTQDSYKIFKQNNSDENSVLKLKSEVFEYLNQ